MYAGAVAVVGNGNLITGEESHPEVSGMVINWMGGDRCTILGDVVARPGVFTGLRSDPVSVTAKDPETAFLSFSVNRFS